MLPCFELSTREHQSSTDERRVYLRAINPVLVKVYLFALLLLGLYMLYPVLPPLGRLVCFPFIILIGNHLWFWLLDNCTVPVAIASIYGFFSIAGVVKLFPDIPHTVGSTLITSGIVFPSFVVTQPIELCSLDRNVVRYLGVICALLQIKESNCSDEQVLRRNRKQRSSHW